MLRSLRKCVSERDSVDPLQRDGDSLIIIIIIIIIIIVIIIIIIIII